MGVKRSLNLYFMNTVYIYSILRRPAEDTAYILSRLWPKIKPAGLIFETLEACKNIVFEGKAAKLDIYTLVFIQNTKLTF